VTNHAVSPSETSMWQSVSLEQILADMEGMEKRTVLRAAAPVDPGISLRQTTPLFERPALDDQVPMNRRYQSRRQSDFAFTRGEVSGRTAAAACTMLDRLDLAIVLLSSDRCVQLANPAALRVAARGDCFKIRAHQLQLIDQHNQSLLEAFLNDRPMRELPRGWPLCVSSRDDEARSYFLFAEWLDTPAPRDRATASLLIYEPHRVGQLSPELLAKLYGLTRMESRLVAALFVAPVLQTAADRCGIGMNTAKTHLKHVFTKCGVCSKAELLRLLALGPRTF
jgi:hypothetical protein